MMEHLFRPTNRFPDPSYNPDASCLQTISELEFDGCADELLSSLASNSSYSLEQFHAFVGDRIVWIGPGVFLCTILPLPSHYNILPRILSIHLADSSSSSTSVSCSEKSVHVFAPTSAHATLACELLFRCMLMVCASSDVAPAVTATATATNSELCHVHIRSNDSLLSVSAPTLASFFASKSSASSALGIQQITLERLTLSQGHCRALMSAATSTLTLLQCTILEEGADTFVECLQSDCGPTELIHCTIGVRALAEGLRSNRRLQSLHVDRSNDLDDPDMTALIQALAENQGLTHLALSNHAIGEEHWNLLCFALKAHPSLESVNLQVTGETTTRPRGQWMVVETMYNEQKAFRMLALAEAIEENTVLHTLLLSPDETDVEIFEESIRPRLEMNLFRPRVLAVKHAVGPCSAFRPKVLGRALQLPCVSKNPNLLWCFLSENVDVAFGSASTGRVIP